MAQFGNAYGTTWRQPLSAMLRWGVEKVVKLPRADAEGLPACRDNDGRALADNEPHLTWVGHATFVMRLGGVLVATDPVWRGSIAYVKRLVAPGVRLESLPGLDVVTVTHNHYDHLDVPTLKRLRERFDPLFVVPRQNGRLLRAAGIERIAELCWWQSIQVGDLEIVLVPAQHWSSRRWILDMNRSLWGGYVFRSREGTAYHAGDTAFEPLLFGSIADSFPALDWAMLPIGAYNPEWFLKTQHMNPEDAGRAFKILGARRLVPMHYGTYHLTDEPVGEPIERLRAFFQGREELLTEMDVGETVRMR
ncbi:MAG: MBL fold metallo-hydrolase [Planctomycetota bacterium]